MKERDQYLNSFRLSEVNEIEIFVLRRLRELCFGEHASVYSGFGFNYMGTRDWQPGDKMSSIDWAQSARDDFNPISVKYFEEGKSGAICILADASLSMRYGVNGLSSGDITMYTIAILGLSGVFFQDQVGLFFFDQSGRYHYVRPKLGRNQVINCLQNFVQLNFSCEVSSFGQLPAKIMGYLRRTGIVPVISDFLYNSDELNLLLEGLASIKSRHDLFVALIDCSFLFDLNCINEGWIECIDIETGELSMFSRREFFRMAAKIVDHQNMASEELRKRGIEVVKVGQDKINLFNSLTDFFFIRKTKRKVTT